MKRIQDSTLLLVSAIALAMALTFLLDLELPIGTAGGIIYIVLVLLSFSIPNPKVTLALAVIGSILTVFRSILIAPDHDYQWNILVPNRIFILFAIWVTAFLVILRNRADLAARRVGERFHAAALAVNEVLYDWDLNTNVVERSEGLYRVTGFTSEQVSPTMDWWFSRIHPEDKPAVQSILHHALENESDYILEYRLRHCNGYDIHLWDRGVVVRDAHGKAQRVIGGALDVTERLHAKQELRETNQKLRALIQASPLAIVTINQDGNVSTWNRAAEKIFGWRTDEVVGHPPPFIVPEEQEKYRKLLAAEMTGKSSRGLELKRIRKDGQFIDIALWTAPLRDQSGNVMATLELSEDITQLKRSQEEHTKLEQQLYQTQKLEAVGQLAAGIAHDVNNLLTVILSSVESLGDAGERDDACGPLHMIEEAAKQATGMTRSLLTFSRRVPAVKRMIDLRTAVRDAEHLLRRLLDSSIDFAVNLPSIPVWVHADSTQLQQVVLNLAFNARDAMPQGGKLSITVSMIGPERIPEWMRSVHSGHSFVNLCVKDTGTGIPPDVQSNIFEPFFTTKSRNQGTGLGLSIVQSIIKDHGGHIELESTGEGGSTFCVILPCSSADGATDENCPVPLVPRAHGEVLLLAEDNLYVRQIISSTLKTWGYDIIEAETGSAVLESCSQNGRKARAIVLDQNLSEKNGLECIREIRLHDRDIPIIMTTTGLRPEEESALDSQTFILNKPFQISELARLLADVL